jgi:hypothetical protein
MSNGGLASTPLKPQEKASSCGSRLIQNVYRLQTPKTAYFSIKSSNYNSFNNFIIWRRLCTKSTRILGLLEHDKQKKKDKQDLSSSSLQHLFQLTKTISRYIHKSTSQKNEQTYHQNLFIFFNYFMNCIVATVATFLL